MKIVYYFKNKNTVHKKKVKMKIVVPVVVVVG